jgi:hypothetical protein
VTAKELLGLIVRVTGLGLMLCGVFDLGHLLVVWLGLPTASHLPNSAVAESAAYYLVVGLIVLLSAKLVMRLVYGRDR